MCHAFFLNIIPSHVGVKLDCFSVVYASLDRLSSSYLTILYLKSSWLSRLVTKYHLHKDILWYWRDLSDNETAFE